MQRTMIGLAAFAAIASAASARTPPAPAPGGSSLVKNITACRAIADPGARLACYDGNVDKLATANDTGGLVVLDREDVHAARRSLFGFSGPRLPVLESRDKKDGDRKTHEAETQIDATIRSAHLTGLHDWSIVLDDGATWATTEAPVNDPKAGDAIRIKRAALGSYLANIAGQRAVRIRRIG